jgi:DNA (cytosine-5)-methyltransferase 1
MMGTFASLFSGGGGADIGALQAGYTPLWAVEYDAAIAACATRNLPDTRILVAPVQDVDYSALPRVDWLHASPPCPNFSIAKDDAAETELDIEMARGTVRAIQEQQPLVFSLEQVYGYRDSVSFALIVQALRALRYDVQWWHLNAADYGVPQTRRRLILVACRNVRVVRPAATHCQGGRDDMFGGLLPWIGWYEAIQDIIDTLPDSEFAPWQLARLPTDVRESVMVGGANTSEPQAAPGVGVSALNEPTRAVMASHSDCWRALVSHRIVKMTPRALARFQSFPDWYELPERNALACRIIGNAVPPLLMQRVMEAQNRP